jgi:hypothetical protein
MIQDVNRYAKATETTRDPESRMIAANDNCSDGGLPRRDELRSLLQRFAFL